jgi:hypothetical protein
VSSGNLHRFLFCAQLPALDLIDITGLAHSPQAPSWKTLRKTGLMQTSVLAGMAKTSQKSEESVA